MKGIDLLSPLHSLERGRWFKLICGASYQHAASIRNLALAYTLAGADCIDVAADEAAINAAIAGIKVASRFQTRVRQRGYQSHCQPFLMISINDGEDPHFRKAEFDPQLCPANCHRPCEQICPAGAIQFGQLQAGVIEQLCYGCGRCLPVCPQNLISTRSSVTSVSAVCRWLSELPIDALEIHTQVGHEVQFHQLWQAIAPQLARLKLLAISCPYAPGTIDYLKAISRQIEPLPCPLIWQTDGRPMSGDIGMGTTHPAIKFAQKMLQAEIPGYIQLAGGTNQYTVAKLRSLGLFPHQVSGVAYGSYGRKLLGDVLSELEKIDRTNQLENYPNLLWRSVAQANYLVSQVKSEENRQ